MKLNISNPELDESTRPLRSWAINLRDKICKTIFLQTFSRRLLFFSCVNVIYKRKEKKEKKKIEYLNIQKMMTMFFNTILMVQFEKKKKISSFSTC